MGDWAYSYDALDRLMSATPAANAPSQYAGRQACWAYDAFGNRTLEAVSSAACQTKPTPQALVAYNPVNNRVSSSTLSSATLTAGSYQYDAAGNTLFDGNNRYWYDAEGQLCAVQSLRTTGAAVVQYVYDAEGARIAKGTLAAAPTAYTASCSPPLGAGFTLTARYLVELGGDQVTELNGAGVWQHSNVWAGGKLVGTYDTKGLHFDLADPLGTKRVQANASGQVDEYCMSLPFGNDVNNPVAANCVAPNPAPATADDATEHHFTQKERDSETGNDYFGARYYASSMGRWMSPDRPFADQHPANAQSWNLYSYTRNNPLHFVDDNGRLARDANGNVVFTPTGSGTVQFLNNSPVTLSNGSSGTISVTWQAEFGNVYSDNMVFLPVEASRATSDMSVVINDANGNTIQHGGSELLPAGYSNTADCHGTTFADGQVWINNDQVPNILYGDNYSPTNSPTAGDVGVFSTNGSPFTAQHSVTVDATDASGAVTSVTSKGGITPKIEAPPTSPQVWPDPNASLNYYHQTTQPPQTQPNQ